MPLPRPAGLPSGFRRLAWSNLLAQSAEQIALAAVPLVAVLALGAGTGETGLLQTVLTLPFVVFAIPAGLLADRVARGRLMAAAEFVRAAALLVLLALLLAGGLSATLLALCGFVAVCGTVVFSVAAPSLVPALVADSDLPLANARLELARTAAFAAGPAAGGALVGFTGAPAAFAVAALMSAGAACLLGAVREPARPVGPPRHPVRDIAEGARFVLHHRLLRPIFATQVAFNTAFFTMFAVFVPYAVRTLGLSPQGVGVTLGLYGAGMVAGALAAPRLMRILRFGTVVAIGPVVGFLASLTMVATVAWPSPALAGASFFLFGVGPILWVISTTTLRQSVTPAELLGRVSAINIMTYGARPVGSGLGALIGAAWGAEASLVAAACLFALQAGMILVSPATRLEGLPSMG